VQNETNFRFDLGLPYSVNGLLRYGIGAGRMNDIYFQNKDFLSTDTADNSVINKLSTYAAVEKNTLNEKQFYTDGKFRKSKIRITYGSENFFPGSTSPDLLADRNSFWNLELSYKDVAFYKLSRKVALAYFVETEIAFKPLLSNYYSTLIEAPAFNPGFFTSALFLEKYRSYKYLAVGLIPVYQFRDQAHLKMEFYLYAPFREFVKDQDSKVSFSQNFPVIRPLLNVSASFLTPVGPLTFNAGYLSGEDYPWLLQMSFGYLIFNKKINEE